MHFIILLPIIYYWLFAIAFELVYLYFVAQKLKKQLLNSNTYKMYWPMVSGFLQNSANAKIIWSVITGPTGMIFAAALLFIAAPVLLPLSIFSLAQKLVGYKSKLEKAADTETKALQEHEAQSNEFMKTEGVIAYESDKSMPKIEMPPPPII